MTPIGYADDVNMLVYGKRTEDNCRTLERAHEVCVEWARTHRAAFAPHKYELIHLSRRPQKFNMGATVSLGRVKIDLLADIRVLSVQIDSKLRWGRHLAKVDKKAAGQMFAISMLGVSTWGATFRKARHVYSAVVRSIITFGAAVWHQNKNGALTAAEARMERIQNQTLRNVTGSFKRVSTRTLEAETHVKPMRVYLSRRQDAATLRKQKSGREVEIKEACRVIRG